MPGTGPEPNPNSRRQTGASHRSSWVELPIEGYQGPTPPWPLPDFTARELQVWTEIWHTPQAVAWHRLGWTHDVAMYVRFFVRGETSLDHAREARMWSDRLGLNPTAMLKNRWRVRVDEVAEVREASKQPKNKRALKVAPDA